MSWRSHGVIGIALGLFAVAAIGAGLASDADQPGLSFALIMVSVVALFSAIILGDAA